MKEKGKERKKKWKREMKEKGVNARKRSKCEKKEFRGIEKKGNNWKR